MLHRGIGDIAPFKIEFQVVDEVYAPLRDDAADIFADAVAQRLQLQTVLDKADLVLFFGRDQPFSAG